MITKELIDAAQAAQKKWKVWASVSLAQYGIESAWGTKEPKGSNNGFGIQQLPGLPWVSAYSFEYRHGVKVGVMEKFAIFKSIEDAFDKHGELIATNKEYSGAMATTNAQDFVKVLGPVYATAPTYAEVILGLMRADSLEQYDTLSPAPSGPPKPPAVLHPAMSPDATATKKVIHPSLMAEIEAVLVKWL